MIGVFDSGVGGLTVVKQLIKRFSTDIIYLGDTARLPYGTKSEQTVVKYSLQSSEFLIKKGVNAIIVACNTASSVAIDKIKETFDIPVFGVIEPAAKEASAYDRICVIGTESTISSGAYLKKIMSYNKKAQVTQKACPMFVPLVESGWIDNEIAHLIAKEYLEGLRCDALILGCTHYPLLKNVISKIVECKKLIDSGEALAQNLKNNKIVTNGEGQLTFYTTDSKERFAKLGRLFLGRYFNGVKLVDL